MAQIAKLHCPRGHLMRWSAVKKTYTHACTVDRVCTLPVAPWATSWE